MSKKICFFNVLCIDEDIKFVLSTDDALQSRIGIKGKLTIMESQQKYPIENYIIFVTNDEHFDIHTLVTSPGIITIKNSILTIKTKQSNVYKYKIENNNSNDCRKYILKLNSSYDFWDNPEDDVYNNM